MKINGEETKRGICITTENGHFNISYPDYVWKKFRKNLKKVLVDNLTYSKTMALALVDESENLEYSTSTPMLKSFFDACCVKDIPRMQFDNNNGLKTEKILQKFINSGHTFLKNKPNYPYYPLKPEGGAITAFSFGKDSLLSYALLSEIGLEQQPVYVRDMLDDEALRKDILKKEFEKEFKKKIEVIDDNCDNIFLDKHHKEFNPLLTNAMNNYALMLLPFAYYKNYRYLVFGNERNLSHSLINKDGFKSYASYDQSSEWLKQQAILMKILTSNKLNIFSPIESLHNLPTMKILNSRYPEYAKYQLTCPLDEKTDEDERWCSKCSECAKIFAIMKALNIDVEKRGFKKDMFSAENKQFYTLFDGKKVLAYDKPKESRDEQLLIFYLAHKNNAPGYLIEEFKKNFLEEAKDREDELYKKYLTSSSFENMPFEIKKKITPILKEELK